MLFDYHRVLILLAQHNNPHASWWLDKISVQKMKMGKHIKYQLLPILAEPEQPKALSYLSKGTGHFFARTDWSPDALWFSFVAGPYTESHAHYDQGAISLYFRNWMAVSENIWTHSGIKKGVEFQNVLAFYKNKKVLKQVFQKKINMEVNDKKDLVFVSADLSAAYQPELTKKNRRLYPDLINADIQWFREVRFDRLAFELLVSDKFSSAEGIQAVWQLNVPDKPEVTENGIKAGNLLIQPIIPSRPKIELIDWMTHNEPGSARKEFYSGWKIVLSGAKDEYKIKLKVDSK